LFISESSSWSLKTKCSLTERWICWIDDARRW
jgi:hypothetical protein